MNFTGRVGQASSANAAEDQSCVPMKTPMIMAKTKPNA
jgi:hypothetical protein